MRVAISNLLNSKIVKGLKRPTFNQTSNENNSHIDYNIKICSKT